ncbi:hypothetical protein CE195_00820 [Sodalis-like symbiont of Philaenus spumarius]|nr:hypothetical protein CE195_00820 [Sodalis-like symbiont of Philaenus spumarius]
MKRLVDIQGQPLVFSPDSQTAKSDIPQVASRAPAHPASGITPNRAALCLRAAERGDMTALVDLAADLEEKDTHLFSELSKRRLALHSVEWRIQPPDNPNAQEKAQAVALEARLADASWFDNALFDATDALLKGYAMQEIIWGPPRDGEFFPRAVHWRDPALFCVNPDDYRELRLRDGSHAGQVLQPFGWICHEAKAKTGYPGTQGLVRTLIWPFIFKNYSVRDFAEFLEIYGLPLRVGKYPSGASAEQKSALMRAVMDIGRRAGGIIPAGMSLEFEAAANGQSDPFMAMITWGERAISKAILGGTLTSEAGDKGARSLGEVHNAVRKEIRNADLRQLSRTFNRDLIYPLLALNSPVPLDPRRLPRLVFDTLECEDMASFAEAIPKLATGMAIPVSWIYDKLRIPVPDGNEAVFTVSSPPAVAHTALSATLTPAAPTSDALDAVETALDAPGLNASADPLLAPVIAAIREQGPEAALEQAAILYPEMDDRALIELLTRATFALEVWGRLDATTD